MVASRWQTLASDYRLATTDCLSRQQNSSRLLMIKELHFYSWGQCG